LKLFLAGMTVTLGNPKIMMFYMALLPSIIDIQAVTMVGWAELVATMLMVLIVIDISWALLAARARSFLKSRRAVRMANRASTGTMAGAAVAIAMR
jgi:threonine/homoserine/homoserine lactone efflux protein